MLLIAKYFGKQVNSGSQWTDENGKKNPELMWKRCCMTSALKVYHILKCLITLRYPLGSCSFASRPCHLLRQ